MDIVDEKQEQKVHAAVETIYDEATESRLSSTRKELLHNMVFEHITVFQTSFLSSHPADVVPPSMKLVPGPTSVPVNLNW